MYYGILAACIAAMVMFMGLFALSVPPESSESALERQSKVAVEAVQTPVERVATH